MSVDQPNSIQDLHLSQLVDTNPEETREWHQSLEALLKNAGPVRARYLMLSLLREAHEQNIDLPISTIHEVLTERSFQVDACEISLSANHIGIRFFGQSETDFQASI